MLHLETINADTLELLKKLQSLEELKGARLVGGTALALQLGHRKSVDLDLFTSEANNIDNLTSEIKSISANTKLLSSSKNMRFYFVDGVKVDIVTYPYKWLSNPVCTDNVILASLEDIAAMKISAITNRGTKKDFVDLFFLLKKFSMNQIMEWYKQKYPDAVLFSTIKSLTYFDDAEHDPMPTMLCDCSWEQIKSKIIKQALKYKI